MPYFRTETSYPESLNWKITPEGAPEHSRKLLDDENYFKLLIVLRERLLHCIYTLIVD